MSSKFLDSLSRKLKEDEVIVDIIPVNSLSRGEKKQQLSLAICSKTFYLMSNNSLKKSIDIDHIKLITLSAFSNQAILHCVEEDIWLESHQNVKIIKNILKIREKVFQETDSMQVLLEKQKSLQGFLMEESKIKKFWEGFFSKKKENSQSFRFSNRKSECSLLVNDKDFAMKISRQMYKINFKGVDILFISGLSGFIFNEIAYMREQVDETSYHFEHRETKEMVKMRKIVKENEENARKIKRYLQTYKLEDYKQAIFYALETPKHFEIITPYSKQQQTLEEIIKEQKVISEIDLLSLFYKLMSLTINNFNILFSLSPSQIIVKDSLYISSVFCINQGKVNIDYLSPQQLDPTFSESRDVERINLWKVGMILYEAAFLLLPFPIQYLACVVSHCKRLQIKFPPNDRSKELKDFIMSILVMDPEKRAGGINWQKKIFTHKWVLQSMK